MTKEEWKKVIVAGIISGIISAITIVLMVYLYIEGIKWYHHNEYYFSSKPGVSYKAKPCPSNVSKEYLDSIRRIDSIQSINGIKKVDLE